MKQETEELSQDEVAIAHKELLKYKESKNFKDIVKKYELAGEEVHKDIETELESREEIKLEFSELTKLHNYIKVYEEIIKEIDGSKGGKVFKNDLLSQITRSYTHIFFKVEPGYDAPLYTKLDMLKSRCNTMQTVAGKIDEVIERYEKKIELVQPDNHPYEVDN